MLSNLILLLSVVALLFPMGFFALATPPLLILKHDTPLDGRFVRGMFHHYYAVIIVAASAGAVAHAVLGRIVTAFALGGVAAVVFAIRRWFLPRMDALREAIAANEPGAISRFKRLHVVGMLFNLVQLGVVGFGMAKLIKV